MKKQEEKATFAGGCFWCTQAVFAKKRGVIKTIAGYIGGFKKNPSYQDVLKGKTGHREAVEIIFDPHQISYLELLDVFWSNIDPTDSSGQFSDQGSQYQTAIFYHSGEQKKLAHLSMQKLQDSGIFRKPIATEILKAQVFYPAETYHQDYAQKNNSDYKIYRKRSGREDFLNKIWSVQKAFCSHLIGQQVDQDLSSDILKENLKEQLTPLQYHVTQECGTEPPFGNMHWDNKQEGIYVDIVSGEPLFGSWEKFDSKTGWPSFSRPIDPASIIENRDLSSGLDRIEVRSKKGNSHLGHVFEDGPGVQGRRFCINSAALRFISVKDLRKEGYGEYEQFFV